MLSTLASYPQQENQKENDGTARRKKRQRNLQIAMGILLTLLTIRWYYTTLSLQIAQDEQIRRSINQKYNNHNMNLSRKSKDEIMKLIQHGILHLVDLDVPPGALSSENGDYYEGVVGKFCHLDWDLHKSDPSSYPMFKVLMKNSHGCAAGPVKMDLFHVVETLRELDESISDGDVDTDDDENNDEGSSGVVVHTMEPKGFVFHESRCGSTLVANTLAVSYPQNTRVYSESGPPITAAKACTIDSQNCNRQKAVMLLRDVIYLMGRTNDPNETSLFFKIQSIGTHSISMFTEAFPDTPWIFVFRDSVQVIMSHLKNGRNAVCLRSKQRPLKLLQDMVEKEHGTSLRELSDEEFCAAHLASLCESAYKEYSKPSSNGQMVNYVDIPEVLIHDVLPNHFGVYLDEEATERIYKVNQVYSKGKEGKAGVWKEDSQRKEDMASAEVKKACDTFLEPSFQKLQRVSV